MGAKVTEYTPDADSEDEEGKPQAKEYELPLEPENNLQVVANKKRGASVQKPICMSLKTYSFLERPNKSPGQ